MSDSDLSFVVSDNEDEAAAAYGEQDGDLTESAGDYERGDDESDGDYELDEGEDESETASQPVSKFHQTLVGMLGVFSDGLSSGKYVLSGDMDEARCIETIGDIMIKSAEKPEHKRDATNTKVRALATLKKKADCNPRRSALVDSTFFVTKSFCSDKKATAAVLSGEESSRKRARVSEGGSAAGVISNVVGRALSAVEALETSMVCSICLGPFDNPVFLPDCGHSFCQTCITEPNGDVREGIIKCPECRAPTNSKKKPKPQINVRLKSLMKSIEEFFCLGHKYGCNFVAMPDSTSMKMHEKMCQYKVKRCEVPECREIHLADEKHVCLHRKCPLFVYCGEKGDAHIKNCKMIKIFNDMKSASGKGVPVSMEDFIAGVSKK